MQDIISIPLKRFKTKVKIIRMDERDTKTILSYVGDYSTNYVNNQLIYLYCDNFLTDILPLVVKLTPKNRELLFSDIVETIVDQNPKLKDRRNRTTGKIGVQARHQNEIGGHKPEVIMSKIGTVDISDNIKTLEESLNKIVVGQTDIMAEIQTYFECSLAGTRDKLKPKGCVLFVGDTGTGKTYTAKEIAKHLWGKDWRDHIFVINGSEYQASHETSKLIGSPPGYVGHNEKPAISQHFNKCPDSILLVDEFEKANDSLQDLFLHILDEGYMNDSRGNSIDFTKSFIIFTSNIGTKEVLRKNKLGFTMGIESVGINDQLEVSIRAELNKACRPEFLKRFDEIIIFNSLSSDDIYEISKLEVQKLFERIKDSNPNLEILVDEEVYENLSQFDEFGPVSARDITYSVRKKLEIPLSKCILKLKPDTKLKIYVESDDTIGVSEVKSIETGDNIDG
jgi:ATP-dependent Clp protease ATP-binding subunit ClpC